MSNLILKCHSEWQWDFLQDKIKKEASALLFPFILCSLLNQFFFIDNFKFFSLLTFVSQISHHIDVSFYFEFMTFSILFYWQENVWLSHRIYDYQLFFISFWFEFLFDFCSNETNEIKLNHTYILILLKKLTQKTLNSYNWIQMILGLKWMNDLVSLKTD